MKHIIAGIAILFSIAYLLLSIFTSGENSSHNLTRCNIWAAAAFILNN